MAVTDDELPIPTLNLGPPPRRSPWRTLFVLALGLVGIVGLLVATSYIVRSEWFLRGRIDPKLEEMGEKLHGTFSYERVEPVGLTGVRIEGLRFVPDSGIEDQKPLKIGQLIVYPDLSAMLVGDLKPLKLELHDVEAELWLDGGPTGRGHWVWLEAVVDTWTARVPTASRPGGGGGEASTLPAIEIHGGRVSLLSPDGTMPHVGVSVDDLIVRKVGDQMQLDGAINVDGLGYAMLSGDASRAAREAGVVVKLTESPNLLDVTPRRDHIRDLVGADSRFELGGAEVQWPPALILHDIRLTDTHMIVPGHEAAWVEEIGAERITFRLFEQTVGMAVDDLDASVRVQWWEGLGTSIPVSLSHFDALADLDAGRIGAGFQVGDDDEGTLTVEAALDISNKDVAIRVDAATFDAGRALALIPYSPLDIKAGILDGHVSVRYPLDAGLMDVDIFMQFDALDVEAPWLAVDHLEDLELTVDARTRVDLEQRKLELTDGMMSVGELMFTVSASIQQTEGRHVELNVRLAGDSLQGEDIISSIPTGLAPALVGYELRGHVDAEFGIVVDTRSPESLELTHVVDTSNLEVLKYGPRADIPLLGTDAFAVRVATASNNAMIGPGTRNWVAYGDVPRYFVESLVASEDGRFYSHEGFDPNAIERSLVANLTAGKIVRGGSTISQQVIKNLFLSQRKTVSRKLQEAFLTWQLEAQIDKRRIIELYMNLAQWGRDVYGVRAASGHYFDKAPGSLGVRESLFLASILPAPVMFGEQYAEGFVRADRLDKMRRVLKVLHHRGLVDSSSYQNHDERIKQAAISRERRPKPPQEQASNGHKEPGWSLATR